MKCLQGHDQSEWTSYRYAIPLALEAIDFYCPLCDKFYRIRNGRMEELIPPPAYLDPPFRPPSPVIKLPDLLEAWQAKLEAKPEKEP